MADAMEGGVQTEWFTVPIHQEIWECILRLDIKGSMTLDIDVMLEFGEDKRMDVTQILNSCESGVQFKSFFRKVKDATLRRRILNLTMKLQDACHSSEFDTAEQILEVADREITALTVEDEITLEKSNVVADRAYENIKIRQESGGVYGIPSGISRLDGMTCGWQPGDVTLIAARTSVGKTALGIQLAIGALKANKRVLLFSLEMTNDQVMERMLSNVSRVPIRIVVDNTCNETQKNEFITAKNWLHSSPLMMDDDGSITVGGIRAKARKLARRGLDMIVIDYAQLIRPEDGRQSREQQVANVSKGIKALAKELRIPIIMLAQLKRTADEQNRKPRLSDLRESGSLEQDADLVLMIWRRDDDPEKTVISITKQRQGRCGDVDVNFKTSTQEFLPAAMLS